MRTKAFYGLIAATMLASCAAPGAEVRTAAVVASPAPLYLQHPDGQVLWGLVNGKCVPDQQTNGDPQPCAEVSIGTGVANGYAVLKDKKGPTQYLVLPTKLISGIEDGQLLQPGTTNYFDPAWRVRALVEKKLGAKLAREDVSVAVNSFYGRTQDLLHLHVDCLRIGVRNLLKRNLSKIGPTWGPLTVDGHPFQAMLIDGDDSVPVDPFVTLAQGLKVPAIEMGRWTLVLAGVTQPSGKPGFVLLAARADLGRGGYTASGEDLQDHYCSGRGPAAGAKASGVRTP